MSRLISVVYEELRVIARARLRGPASNGGATLDTTGLVHEAYLKLFEGGAPAVGDRSHFFALSSRAMRHVLVDHFRRRGAKKRSGAVVPMAVLEREVPVEQRGDVLLALDEALQQLERVEPRAARIVEYRFFGGMTEVDIARVLNVSDRTVRNDWRKARAWLARELGSEVGGE